MSDHSTGTPGLHVEPISTYLAIFAALMLLTGLTVWVAFLDLGVFNNFVALAIAATKATLVILFFMHLRHASRATAITAVAGFFWLVILVAFTLSDFFTRGWVATGK